MFDFDESLQMIEKNIDEAIGAFFVLDNIMQKAIAEEVFLVKLNHNIYFWNNIIYSLQSSYFMSLGRIFDQRRDTFSINVFLNKCTENFYQFSKTELRKRKATHITNSVELQEYIDNTYEPTLEDFRKIKNIVNDFGKVYRNDYKDIRHLIFAHTKLIEKSELKNLFLNTSKNKLEEIFITLKYLMTGLFGLYHNGQKIEIPNNINRNDITVLSKIKEESNNVLKLI